MGLHRMCRQAQYGVRYSGERTLREGKSELNSCIEHLLFREEELVVV